MQAIGAATVVEIENSMRPRNRDDASGCVFSARIAAALTEGSPFTPSYYVNIILCLAVSFLIFA